MGWLERDDLAPGGVEQVQHGGERTEPPERHRRGLPAGRTQRDSASWGHPGTFWLVSSIPDKPTIDGLESKWRATWDDQGTYRFDRTKSRDDVYSIDTPPPTVSGSLHIGHVMSYTHTDTVARYQRMRGHEVFYPMGWDDNGLNVERRVQLLTGTLCDPVAALRPRLRRPAREEAEEPDPHLAAQLRRAVREGRQGDGGRVPRAVGHRRPVRGLGRRPTPPSVRSRPASPRRAFLRLLDEGVVYRSGAPTLWDVDMKTAVAQAELEDREIAGAYHKLDLHGSRRRRPAHRHDAPRAAPRVRRAGRPPRRRALPAAVRPDRHSPRCSASRSRSWPTSWPSPTRAPASP